LTPLLLPQENEEGKLESLIVLVKWISALTGLVFFGLNVCSSDNRVYSGNPKSF